MERGLVIIVCVCFVATFAVADEPKEGPCFNFLANSYIHFWWPSNFVNDGSAHYSLKFRTVEENGIILYAQGQHGDEEALFLRAGKLTYHLFNTSPTGVEGYFGGFFQTRVNVNTGDWVTVHMYRMFEVEDSRQRRMRNQTGIVVEMNGQEYRHVDYMHRQDINIQSLIYIGGYPRQLSETVGYFRGQIKDIWEEKNDHVFEEPSLNYRSRVQRECHEYNP